MEGKGEGGWEWECRAEGEGGSDGACVGTDNGSVNDSCSPWAGAINSGAGESCPASAMRHPALLSVAWMASCGHSRTTRSKRFFDLKATKLVSCHIFIEKHNEETLVAYLLCLSKLMELTLAQFKI